MAKRLVSKANKAAPSSEKTFSPRHLARSVAKANMRKAGVPHINKNFSLNWRDWVVVKEKRKFKKSKK